MSFYENDQKNISPSQLTTLIFAPFKHVTWCTKLKLKIPFRGLIEYLVNVMCQFNETVK